MKSLTIIYLYFDDTHHIFQIYFTLVEKDIFKHTIYTCICSKQHKKRI